MKTTLKTAFFILILFFTSCARKEQNTKELKVNSELQGQMLGDLQDRWKIAGDKIVWQVNDAHKDHIEMSGFKISGIISYGTKGKDELYLSRKIVWPMLRTIPNDTHASLIAIFEQQPEIIIDEKPAGAEEPFEISINGVLTIRSKLGNKTEITRVIFPSTDKPVFVEKIVIKNVSKDKTQIELPPFNIVKTTKADEGVYGAYELTIKADKSGKFSLAPGETIDFGLYITGKRSDEKIEKLTTDTELRKRLDFIESLKDALVFNSPSQELNLMFAFAKIRATESIYATKGGLMHGPGGGSYYAAIWANDQAEYVNPFFPFLGNAAGNESALNSFRHFARFMNDEYKPIPSSIIAEGDDIWNGAGDRGDQAMIAYGAARFAMANGDSQVAGELWPLITWCLEYLERKKTSDGVIASNTDELEGRFPTGDANLTTSVLTFGALRSAYFLAKALKKENSATLYKQRALKLRMAIEDYFGADMHGFHTYRYYDGNDKLRSWISIPLTMGIFERREGTIAALLSPYLWNKNGVYTQEGEKTFWDRATLYTFRGIFAAGETDTAMNFFKYYSRKRLLGNHVPYAVEAWPEGGQRHLSAASGLYCRVVTEGVFGIEPNGFNSFFCAPMLPSDWDYMSLKHIKAFNRDFDIDVVRVDGGMKIKISSNGELIQELRLDGKSPVEIVLN